MAELLQIKQKRARVKGQITRIQSFFEANQNCSAAEAQVRLKKIEDLWTAFEEIQQVLEGTSLKDEKQSEQFQRDNETERVVFEERYYLVAAQAQHIIDTARQPQGTQQQPNNLTENIQANVAERRNKPKLPEIKLPEFNGEYTKWLFFKNSFETTVHNDADLSGPQKYQYLVGVLTNEARKVIEGFSNENYEQAWQLLKNTYDNEMMIIDTHLDELLNLPVISKDEKADSMRQLIWHIQTHMSALKSLQQPIDQWDTIILHLAKKKLDYTEHRDWQNSVKDRTPRNMPKLADFIKFINERCHTLRMINQTKPSRVKQSVVPERKGAKRVVLTSASSQCKICQGAHQTFRCEDLIKLSPDDRKKCIIEKRLCINCLNIGHQVKECKASVCKKCSGRHNTILHREETRKAENDENATATVVTHCTDSLSERSTSLTSKVSSHVLLSTAQIYVRDINEQRICCRALLDPGSQSNLMTQDLLQRLRTPWTKKSMPISGIDQMQTDTNKVTQVKVEAIRGDFSMEIECHVLPTITVSIPQRGIKTGEIRIPRSMQLADPTYDKPGTIDLLIGAGPYWKILIGSPKNKIHGQPALQNTKLGWILGGELHLERCNMKDQVLSCLAVTNKQLQQQIERFWKIESLHEVRHFTMEERACERHFTETTRREKDGRFTVRLPIRPNVKLGESRQQAKGRFEALERRFHRNPELKEAYCDFMEEYKDSGHMTQISEEEISQVQELYFIPHQAVTRPDSLTTKLRVVFDASAKTTSGSSLNDKLWPGPNLQRDLFGILIRFRTHQYVITADIARMFRQILIDKPDRLLQLILWRKNAEETLKIYQLNTVTYGTASAPYHAMRCLQELAIQHHEEYPVAARAIMEDFYMDDVLSGKRLYKDVVELQRQLLELLKGGQFLLRKWRSNEPRVLQSLPNQETNELFIIDKDTAKALGLLWNSTRDSLQYKTDLTKQKIVTKRAALSRISQVFDPLGLVGPILIRGKIFMQKLWAEDLQWDQSLPSPYLSEWSAYCEQLSELNSLQIPRNVNCDNISDHFDLFGFGDASQSAIGACLYAVSLDKDGNVNSQLLCAKSRVAPLKTLSLPRLELEAALLLSQLYLSVKTALPGRISRVRLWSDSTIVLGWIKTQPSTLKTFVANRIAKIQDTTEQATWSHVPSNENPADILSRGTTVAEMRTDSLWWYGPAWIRSSGQQPEFMLEPELDLPEKKRTTVTMTAIESFEVQLLHKYSSFSKLCRIIAYCYRFIERSSGSGGDMVSRKRKIRPLEVHELNKAENIVLKWVQQDGFQKELQCLRNNRNLHRKSKLASLCPFVDKSGLMRVGGRLRHASIPENQKHPIILPAKHHVSSLIMQENHKKLLHCSPEQLLHHTRQRYWPINGRRLAKGTVKSCLQCFRYRPAMPNALMGDLPKERVAMASRPFTVTGVDYAGPFQIRESRRRGRMHVLKGYVALFVCFSTKAVHLEMVTSLTAEAFLATLSRFTARRGLCTQLISDNGTNFVGAARELQEIQEFLERAQPEIVSFLAKQRISWSFIPPRAPHFGGLWEAGVKIMKKHLYTVTQGKVLTYEEYNTLIIEIEAILNSRPLTPLTNNPDDLNILTPFHFLTGDSLTQPVQYDYLLTPDNRLSDWQGLQKSRQRLWQRWQREYLQELQKRSKWITPGANIELNTLVLLIEDNVPPLRWPLGRVIAVHPGADGQVRVATVKTQAGCYKRAIRKMCPLPLTDQCNTVSKDY